MNQSDQKSDLAALLSGPPIEADDEPQTIQPGEIEALVQEYRDIRDELADRRHEFQEYEERQKGRQEQISMRLREISDSLGLETLVTRAGTAYKTIVRHYRVANFEDVIEYCKATNNFHILEKRVAKLATQEIHNATGAVPPGIEFSSEIEFRVMKNAKSR